MEYASTGLALVDYAIFGVYVVVIICVGLLVSRRNRQSTEGYFLAGKSLPWWAVGASLIAANISAEQFIGMSGSGFSIGLGIASYEWASALTLLLVGKFFLPIFIKQEIYTIPQFVEKRYNTTLKTILAVFWICLYIFVNLTSVLYLGGLALQTILGVPMMYSIFGLALFAVVYSVYGGLSAVVWTDVIQVAVLVFGGLATTFMAVSFIGGDGGLFSGFGAMYDAAPGHFEMILSKDNPQFMNLPGIAVLIGGMWIANTYYWGFNQYIIQRTFASKSVDEAQRGLIFAAFLKLIIPFIVVIPGIAAFVIINDPELMAKLGSLATSNMPSDAHADFAYPWLTQFLPAGIKGVVFAALAAAIVSSLASMLNSTATIFTLDIYQQYIDKKASDAKLVNVGRVTSLVAIVIACFVAPFLGSIGQAFMYIQEYTGLVSPGILAVFMLGLFWKKTTAKGAIVGVLASIPIALLLKFLPLEMPFLDQMFYTFILTCATIIFVTLSTSEHDDDPNGIPLTKDVFATSSAFNIGAYAILIILAVLYSVFW